MYIPATILFAKIEYNHLGSTCYHFWPNPTTPHIKTYNNMIGP